MSAPAFVVKIKFGDDLRRVTLPRVPQYAELSALVAQLFPAVRNAYSLKYVDPDGDKVTVASDSDVVEASSLALAAKQPLKFFVCEKSAPSAPAPAPAVTPAPAPAEQPDRCGRRWGRSEDHGRPWRRSEAGCESDVHFGVQCDGCNAFPIKGIRHKCNQCPNFDLCSACEAKKVHDPSHTFTVFATPAQRFRHGGCGRRWGQERHCERTEQQSDAPEDVVLEVDVDLNHCPPWVKFQRTRHYARFVQDVTIEDGKSMAPGAKFLKVWKIKNTGELAWPEQSVALFVGGDQLGAPASIPVGAVPPGSEVDISVEMTAPQAPGRYVSYWRMSSAEGARFGQRVWADILVTAPAPAPAPVEEVVVPATLPPPLAPTPAPAPADETSFPGSFLPAWYKPSLVSSAPLPANPEEEKSLATLRQMGFAGDNLLAVLRKNKGKLNPTVLELLG